LIAALAASYASISALVARAGLKELDIVVSNHDASTFNLAVARPSNLERWKPPTPEVWRTVCDEALGDEPGVGSSVPTSKGLVLFAEESFSGVTSILSVGRQDTFEQRAYPSQAEMA
jgi:hypothetical protein